jgi:TPP-dependent trihydroxycyclohexane-1,2-dione (THcHDO) dehydratase
MAEVHGLLTGELAVALGTLGPGATNLLTGVADANMDRSPMLVLTGQAGALEDGFASGQPTLVGLPIDYRENLLLTERLGMIDETL